MLLVLAGLLEETPPLVTMLAMCRGYTLEEVEAEVEPQGGLEEALMDEM